MGKSLPLTVGRPRLVAAIAICTLWVAPASAMAQAHIGVHGGINVAPAVRIPNVTAQGYAGAHLETEPLIGRLIFRPNVEASLGDGLELLSVNGEFVWKFERAASGWSAYAGAGPSMSVFRFEASRFGDREAETSPGLNLLAGFEHHGGMFFEFKLGALKRRDIARPLLDVIEEVKVGIGYTWR